MHDEQAPILSISGGIGEPQFVLDATAIAGRFSIPGDRLRAYLQRGQVFSRVEKGENEDAGRWRLTLRCGNRIWRGVFSADGKLCSESLRVASGPAPSPQ
ncbi:MAG: DUF6522 family protein [Bosea sp. (in: a-proteobacteria)]|uniref:DUF6522 family protein n=1 Tax=Bosea sp. (in: a-proteobacteria) TaxID=1871050 RepID=UPI003F7C32D0